jgi:glycosyltransferase involved in cell wall biosynthesis
MTNFSLKKLSIVIPSIGRTVLRDTLSKIGAWIDSPLEILVILPVNSPYKIDYEDLPIYVRVLYSRQGQVAQRIHGFENAVGEYVLQLDDDMLLEEATVLKMGQVIDYNPKLAIAPVLYTLPGDLPFFTLKKIGIWALKEKILWSILGGSYGPEDGMGKITKSGLPLGVDDRCVSAATVIVDWLPGGCILHRRSNLVLQNYFPFTGRASFEDLYHSKELTSRGVGLCILTKFRVYTCTEGRAENLKSITIELKILRRFVIKYGYNQYRYVAWVFYRVLAHSIRTALRLKWLRA